MPKMETKLPKPYNWDAKVMAALRKVWRFSPERACAFADAADLIKGFVVCQGCGGSFDKRVAQADHLVPVVPLSGFDSWDQVIHRMQHGTLRILCSDCHKAVSKEQAAQRALLRKQAKAMLKSK